MSIEWDNMDRSEILQYLKERGVDHELIEHPAAFTIDDLDGFGLPHGEYVVKNLFLRDDKKREYYLAVTRKDRVSDLKELRRIICSRPLSFASEDDLSKYMGLTKGAVTPFGILNDSERRIHVIFDADIMGFPVIGVHPNENTSTVMIAPDDLRRIVEDHGNDVMVVEM